jgi:predicted NAD/FAD-binding protein
MREDERLQRDDLKIAIIGGGSAGLVTAPPDQTLTLLEDPTEAERRRFGAWLGDGLQEDAVTSAVAVSKLLGGAAIP